MNKKISKVIYLIKSLGLIPAFVYTCQRILEKIAHNFIKHYFLVSKHAKSLIWLRSKTSDLDVFNQIFIQHEYQPLSELKNVKLIIDCGANVGYSSVYLLNQFADAVILAIEPDKGNYLVAKKNLKPYKDRVTLLNSAIWVENAKLTWNKQVYRDGREWAYHLRECKHGEESVFTGLTIDEILKSSGYDRISILKMDIEGGEYALFSKNYEKWLDKVDAIAIELHDDIHTKNISEVFYKIVKKAGFKSFKSGELIFCFRC